MSQVILPDSPTSVLQLMNADKKALESFANAIIQDVKQGRENPLEIQLLIKKYEFVLNEIKENIKVNVSNEAAKYGDKEFEYGGAKCHYTPTATSYDFTICNDSTLEELEEKLRGYKELVDARKKFLQSLTSTISIVNDNTGEMETISPPLKKQTYGLKVTLK